MTPFRQRRTAAVPLTPERLREAYASMRRTYAANLRCIREARGLKRYGAALELGVSASTWSRWESAQRFPTPPLLAGIAALLQAPVAEFFAPVLADSDGSSRGDAEARRGKSHKEHKETKEERKGTKEKKTTDR